jgi:proton-dependent oligopeptide transporter, POT family
MAVSEPRLGSPTLFGHPTGLFTLFFAEMWERFSFYGMRALLVLYMTKGFLHYADKGAYAIYGAYTAMVYASPFLGGMIADRLLGPRRAVIIGGLLMAAGHLLMTAQNEFIFFVALSLLVCGNGFFKPNISTIVGRLYPQGSPRKDAGFTIFYIGINLGAAMSPILCGYVGETYGWHNGFGLATVGMLVGVAIFAAPTRLTQAIILVGAVVSALAMPFLQNSPLQLVVRIALAVALVAAGVIAVAALQRGGLPENAGRPQDPASLSRRLGGILRYDMAIYIGIAVSVPLIALLLARNQFLGPVLSIAGAAALGYVLYDAFARCGKVERERIFVILVLMLFSLLFFAFFEQAGSSMNFFADRNVDRVFENRHIAATDVGSVIEFRVPPETKNPQLARLPVLTQEQLGYRVDGRVFTMTDLDKLREQAARDGAPVSDQVAKWPITQEHVGMGIGEGEIPASEFQAVNPVFILLFGLAFSALWSVMGKRGCEPSTTIKFALGLLQVGLGFAVLWYGARTSDSRGMVAVSWLLLGYLLHTTGELCLSPVGLSMVTELSPARIVSTMMGAWFLATAVAQFVAGEIAARTSVVHEGSGPQLIPAPIETVHLYGRVFGQVAIAAIISALICLALSPLLTRWMHKSATPESQPELPDRS